MSNPEIILMSAEEFETVLEAGGICLSCHQETDEYVEPDAENYKCSICGSMKVMGVEVALISGNIQILEG